jgi:hypothetical protein
MGFAMKQFAPIVILLAMTVPAHAGFESGNSLKGFCDTKGWQEAVCSGYVTGVYDMLEGISSENAIPPLCVPADVTRGQLQAIVLKFLNEHPELLHYSAAALVNIAIRQAFPCTK